MSIVSVPIGPPSRHVTVKTFKITPMGKFKGQLVKVGTATIALPIWIGMSVALTIRCLRNPIKFFRRINHPDSLLKEDIAGLEHCFIEVDDGVKLHAMISGLGAGKPLVVFLHGFPEMWRSWRHQIEALKDDYEIVAIDMRGFGLSDAPKGVKNYAMGKLCADVAAVVRAVGHSTCMVVGHDWGGAVAWIFAANYPEMVERMAVLCSPHPAAYQDPERFTKEQSRQSWYFLFFMAAGLPELFIRNRDYEYLEDFMVGEAATCTPGAITKEDVDRIKAAFNRPGVLTGAVNYYRALIREQTSHPTPEGTKAFEAVLQMPVLLMYADKDAAFTKGMFVGTEKNAPLVKLVELSECSHWANQDRPELVNEHLKHFLAQGKRTDTGAKNPHRTSKALHQSGSIKLTATPRK